MIGVTGASGFIGAHLMTRLGPDGVSLDLRRLKSPEALAAVLRARGVRARAGMVLSRLNSQSKWTRLRPVRFIHPGRG